ncbi:MAG: hypothetical protein R3E83_20740 [Burkholderiaceae bacterium]
MTMHAPLPGGPRPLPYRLQARGCARATIVLAVAGLVALGFGQSGRNLAIAAAGLAITTGVIGLAIFGLSRSWRQALRRMEAGDYLLHWQYSAREWAPYRDQMTRENRRLSWIIPLALSGSGLVFGIMSHADHNLIGGSLILSYLVPVLVAAAIGWGFAQAISWFNDATMRLMDNEPPEAIIGRQGLYITGQFWPWQTFGQTLTQVVPGTGEPPTLDFHFRVEAGRGVSSRVVAVPIPAGAQAEAERLVARYADMFARG